MMRGAVSLVLFSIAVLHFLHVFCVMGVFLSGHRGCHCANVVPALRHSHMILQHPDLAARMKIKRDDICPVCCRHASNWGATEIDGDHTDQCSSLGDTQRCPTCRKMVQRSRLPLHRSLFHPRPICRPVGCGNMHDVRCFLKMFAKNEFGKQKTENDKQKTINRKR